MRRVDKGGGGQVFFTYDASGQRVRKVWEHGVVEERIYLGGFEIYRKRLTVGGAVDLERETLHVMDDQRRVAMVETKTRESGAALGTADTRWRFQLDNHLGSAMLELDQAGNVISYEEYHPYGSTAFSATSASSEVSAKRYRYTGKERDEETGLYYHGARYYAPWLGRWTAADPAAIQTPGRVDIAAYTYVRSNPFKFVDDTGHEEKTSRAAATPAPVPGPGFPPSGPAPIAPSPQKPPPPPEEKVQRFTYMVGKREVEGFIVPGRSKDVALIYGGIHGDERAAKEVGRRIVNELTKEGAEKPEFTVVVVPDIFGGGQQTRNLKGERDPNRSFPAPGTALPTDDTIARDALGRPLPEAIKALVALREQHKPERILQLHGIRVAPGGVAGAGITTDPRNQGVDATQKQQDIKVASDMAHVAEQEGARVGGNKLGQKGETFIYPTQQAAHQPGVTGGMYFSTASPAAPAANVVLIETHNNELPDELAGPRRAAREKELDAFTKAVLLVFLQR